MLREIIKFRSQKGSLMVEAMAMLALISMVTPVVYKKAAERTSELQDINAASQMRSIITSIDKYMKDNYVTMKKGETVASACGDQSYDAFKASGEQSIEVDLDHFCEYLPYGLSTQSKTFKDFSVAIKKEDTSSGRVMMTAVVVAQPTDEKLQMMRASRIASMIGSNGGVVRDDAKPTADTTNVQGTQGIWSFDLADFGIEQQKPGTVVAASMQSVATSSVGSEDVLYRVDTGYEEMNTMSTDLFMANNNIENVNNLIISGQTPNAEGSSLIVENGKTSLAGNLEALANAAVSGILTVGDTTAPSPGGEKLQVYGSAHISSDIGVGGNATITGNTIIGTTGTETPGTLTVHGATQLNNKLTVEKETTLNNTLDVAGNTTIGKAGENGSTGSQANLTVHGNTEIDGTLSALDNDFQVSKGKLDDYDTMSDKPLVKITDGNLEVTGNYGQYTGIIKSSALETELLQSDWGKFEKILAGSDSLASNEHDTYTLSVGKGFVRVKDSNFAVGKVSIDENKMTNGTISAPGAARLAVNNNETFMYHTNVAMLANTSATIRTGNSVLVATPDFRIKDRQKGSELDKSDGDELFRVASNPDSGNKGVQVSNTDFVVSENANNKDSKIFEVVQNTPMPAEQASIRIRKGVMEIATNTDTTRSDENATGYIQLDRIVGNRAWDGEDLPDSGEGVPYDRFQVNPAYTSVMHDIKLTTRGGARLSDILPDFINKGIYVLDNTYKEDGCGGQICNWEDPVNIFTGKGPGFTEGPNGHIAAAACGSDQMSCAASPWLGYIPAPQCPPGYSKVATLAPIRFNMAQAGIPSTPSYINPKEGRGKYDVWSPKNPEDQDINEVASVDDVMPLTFQKSTWLNTSLKAHCLGGTNYQCSNNDNAPEGKGFQGWSGIMGFIYGGNVYSEYFDETYGRVPASNEFAWNLFPVYNQELTAIADVYCYFDRAKFTGSDDLIDTAYDQIGNFRGPTADNTGDLYSKPTEYKNRLNDPKLKYTDPW